MRDCLGPNPYIRMQRQDYAAECAISSRPFTVFRWRPGTEARYKKTVVCKEIARQMCAPCWTAAESPCRRRDAALGRDAARNETALLGARPRVNIEYQTEQIARRIANGEDVARGASGDVVGAMVEAARGASSARAHEFFSRMARKAYYNKNKTAICTFWLRNACVARGLPRTAPLQRRHAHA